MPPCDTSLVQSAYAASHTELPKQLKVCGFQSEEAVAAALEAGVEYYGIVFVHGSRRAMHHDIGEAERMVSAVNRARAEQGVGDKGLPAPAALGIFERRPAVPLEEDVADINRTVAATGLKHAQLYGFSADEYDSGMKNELVGLHGIVFAASISEREDMERLRVPSDPLVHAFCVDRCVGGQLGGTGKSYDWSWLQSLPPYMGMPFFLAGGINLANIARARGLPQVAVLDISSGAEVDGCINAGRVRALSAAAHAPPFTTTPATP